MEVKETYMRRALELALLGKGKVSPNPMVGCVIVKDDKIIGEGWHQQYGEAHAEVNAINSVADKSQLEGADIYVSLEPCAHHGKTPPCADLVASYPFRKLFIANTDPNPLVSGKGIELVKKAGIEVKTGILEDMGESINSRFFTFMRKKRPYIILKWAQTADGFIARKDFTSKWISNSISRKLVHKWRAEEDAIMVGRNTAMHDNPSLNVRDWSGTNPIRIVIDSSLSLPADLKLFNGEVKTLCYNLVRSEEQENNIFIKLEKEQPFLPQIMDDLYSRKIQSVIVEGGSVLLNSFIQQGLWDEVRRFTATGVNFGEGISAPGIDFKPKALEMLLSDKLEIFFNRPLN